MLVTMLPPISGHARIANWFDGTKYYARQSIHLRANSEMLSMLEDQRETKSLDSQIELAVHNFYISEEISCELSRKKQVIRVLSPRNPIPLYFLHLTVGET